MRVVLVRHGYAGRKDRWSRADELRPLSPRGKRQAEALAVALATLKPTRIISSSHVRCIQTMEPLAQRMHLDIEPSRALLPDVPLKALALVLEVSDTQSEGGVVVCTHGEVMGSVLVELSRRDGVELEHRPPGLKGCAWILEMQPHKLVSARYVAPGDQPASAE